MPIRFHCPKCEQALQLKEEMAGKRVRCPRCHEVSTAPAPVTAITPEPLPAVVEPIEAIAPAPAAGPRATVPPLSPAIEAPRSVAEWQKVLTPQIESEYRPSGRSSPAAVGLMIVGLVPGAAIAEVVAALILLLTWGIYLLLAGFTEWLAGVTDRILIILPFLITLVAFAGFAGACAAGGAVVGAITAEFGKMSKNRSAVIPALLSAVASLPVLLSVSFWLRWMFAPGLASLALLGDATMADLPRYGDSTVVTWIIYAVCGIGSIVAGFAAISFVKEARFCENCQEFHKQLGTAHLPIAHAPAVADILDAHDYAALRAYAEEASPTLDEFRSRRVEVSDVGPPYCVLTLHLCPGCGEGYLEASAHAEEIVKADTKEKKEATWKFRSLAVSKEEGAVVRNGLFTPPGPSA